jgi:hypothetical protein
LLINELKDRASNPKRFFSFISDQGPAISSMIPDIMEKMRIYFPLNQDLFDIAIIDDNIKLVGFKNKEVRLKLTKLIEKIN